ncbi:MAG: TetR/AcrR family transcriptional regulator [Dehalococcoidales bacterium]|nr:TetR/AcrR family transcriptional regulator [Dehalococcoidales bacterium]
MTTRVHYENKREQTTRERRKQIFDAAVHLFIKKGVVNTSMREIAEAVGITTGGLYHFIKSKDEIIRMVTENSIYAHESLKTLRKNLGNVSPTEAFRVCAKCWLTVQEFGLEQTAFLDREKVHMELDVQEAVSDLVRDLIHFFEDLLNDGIEAGEFEVDNVTLVAFNTYMLRGIFATRQWFLKDRFTSEEYATQQTNAILKQILVDRSKIQPGGG